MSDVINICCVGDIMPGGVYTGTNRKIQIEDAVFKYLKFADIRLATLECAVGTSGTFIEEKVKRHGDIVYVKDKDLERLVELNINIVSLANNHIFDLGGEGIKHAISILDKMGIKHFGAGENIEDAKKPAVINIKGKSIAFIGFCDWRDETTGWCLMASSSSPGVNPLYGDYENQIKQLKNLYDYVIVVPHWGIEHSYWPTQHVVLHTRKMIKAGADAIIGGHTHRVQPVIKSKGKIIAYSLGNFFFADRLINTPRSSWYPENNDIDYRFIDKTEGYPYVDKPTLVTFPPKDKDGELLMISINDRKLSACLNFFNYDYSNTIRDISVNDSRLRCKLWFIGLLTRLYSYPLIIYPIKCFVFKVYYSFTYRFSKLLIKFFKIV